MDGNGSYFFLQDLLALRTEAPTEVEADKLDHLIRLIYSRPLPLFRDRYHYSDYPANVQINWNSFFSSLDDNKGGEHVTNNDDTATNDDANKMDANELMNLLVKKTLHYYYEGEGSELIEDMKSAIYYYNKAYQTFKHASHLSKTSLITKPPTKTTTTKGRLQTTTPTTPTRNKAAVHNQDEWVHILVKLGTCYYMSGELEKSIVMFSKVVVVVDDDNYFVYFHACCKCVYVNIVLCFVNCLICNTTVKNI
jgi:hypothetical protein